MSAPWEKFELEFLQEVWGKIRRAEIAKKLERSPAEISKMGQKLGLRRAPDRPAYQRPPEPLLKERNPWPVKDVDRLVELYPDHANAVIAKMLGRSKHAINLKGQKMGLTKSEAFRSQAATVTAFKREGDRTRMRLVKAIREAHDLIKSKNMAGALDVLEAAIQDDQRRKQCSIESSEA